MTGFTFHPGFQYRIIRHIIAAQQHAALRHIQVHAGTEKERAGAIGALGNHQHTAALRMNVVDQTLDLGSMQLIVRSNPVIRKGIWALKIRKLRHLCFIKPMVYRGSVRKEILCMHGNDSFIRFAG